MVAEVYAGLSAFKAMFDMAKGLKDINDATIRNGAVIELQEQILSAQSAQSALAERVGELEKEVACLKTWNAEKKKYELKDVGSGSFVYARKEGAKPTETPHWLCTNCYEDGKKSILLRADIGGHEKLWVCYQCKSHIDLYYTITPSNPTGKAAPG